MLGALSFVALGLGVGVVSGMVGIGGGIFLVPILVYAYGFSQQTAQGTTTALLVPPIGILAALTYYKRGYVDLRAAGLICAGFVLGGLFGARFAVNLPQLVLKRIFGGTMLLVGAKLLLS